MAKADKCRGCAGKGKTMQKVTGKGGKRYGLRNCPYCHGTGTTPAEKHHGGK